MAISEFDDVVLSWDSGLTTSTSSSTSSSTSTSTSSSTSTTTTSTSTSTTLSYKPELDVLVDKNVFLDKFSKDD